METIIINTKDKSNAKLILELVRKIGGKGKLLGKTEQEYFLLGSIMEESKTGDDVAKEKVLEKLKGK